MNAKQRMKVTQREIEVCYGFISTQNHRDIAWVDAEFNTSPDSRFNFGVTYFKLPLAKALVEKWIKKEGFVKCSMKEATCLLTVGKKIDGMFVAKKFKNYWLKPNPNA